MYGIVLCQTKKNPSSFSAPDTLLATLIIHPPPPSRSLFPVVSGLTRQQWAATPSTLMFPQRAFFRLRLPLEKGKQEQTLLRDNDGEHLFFWGGGRGVATLLEVGTLKMTNLVSREGEEEEQYHLVTFHYPSGLPRVKRRKKHPDMRSKFGVGLGPPFMVFFQAHPPSLPLESVAICHTEYVEVNYAIFFLYSR